MAILRVLNSYKLSDIVVIPTTQEIVSEVTKWAKMMGKENFGLRTRDGGSERDIKGCLGQWAVHQYLTVMGWDHEYSPPYVEKQYGDAFDIKFCGDIWDVKCRSWWKEDYFYNIDILMGKHEKTEAKPCDYYIFTTTDREYKNIYILGGKTYYDTWNELKEVIDQSHLPFPAEGSFKSRTLTPIRKLIMRV
jgi:hypothetical protein